MVYFLSVLVACAENCVVQLGCIMEWISRKPVCGSSTWWLFHIISCLPSQFIPGNAPEWSVSGDSPVSFQHIWHQGRWLLSVTSLISTWDSIGRECAYTVHIPWAIVGVPVSDWQGYPPVVGCICPFEFHSIHSRCLIGVWGYILEYFPRVEYLLWYWCTHI